MTKLSRIVWHLCPGMATVEFSWCAIFRIHPIERLLCTGLEVAWMGGRYMTPLHMISHIVGLSKDLLHHGSSWLDTSMALF
jgi:hypothetical protein